MKHDWTKGRFSEIFDLQMGKTPSRDNPMYWNGTNAWVSIADLKGKYIDSTKEGITDTAIAESGINKVPQGTVIMSFKLTVGRAAITNCDLFTNEAIMSFSPKKNEILPDFIYYYLKGYKWKGANKAVMGQTLNKKSISDNIFSYPSLSVQEQIVSELDKVSEIIEKKKQQVKELDNLAQSIFYDMFGDPVENDKGWRTCSLGDMCEIGSSKRIFAEEYKESGVPFFRGKEVSEKSNGMQTSVELFIGQDRYDEIKKKYGVPKVGDILLTAVGTIGNIWVVDTNEPFYFKDGNVLWLQKKTQASSTYLKYLLESLIDAYKRSMANGCAYSALTIMNLKKMPTNITPFALQQSFAKKIEAIEKQKELINASIKESQTLFDARMDYWFGE